MGKYKICLKICDENLKHIFYMFKLYIDKYEDIDIMQQDIQNDEHLARLINENNISLLIVLDSKESNRIIKENDIEIIYNEKYKKSFVLASDIQCDFDKSYKCDLKRRNNLSILNKANMPSIIVKIDRSIMYNHNVYQSILNNIINFLKKVEV